MKKNFKKRGLVWCGGEQKEIKWLLKDKYKGKATNNFFRDIKRLEKGEPLDYVIGFTVFLGCKIDLSEKSLIPRQETEFWIQKAIKYILTYSSLSGCFVCGVKREIKILDIFAGSGCIGVAISRHVKKAKVVFTDKNKKCLEQIKINCKLNGVSKKRYKIIQSDVFEGLNPPSPRLRRTKYDFIFANPPYIAKTRIDKVQKSVLKFEPKSALFGGKDGLFYIRKFLKDAKKYLNKGGVIFMEFDSPQKKEIEEILTRQNFSKKNFGGQEKYKYSNYEFHRDQYGRWRWVMVEYE